MKRLCGALLCALIILNMAACSAQQEETKTSARGTETAPVSTENSSQTPPETQTERDPGEPLDVKDAPKICVDRVYSIPMPSEDDPERVFWMDPEGNLLGNVIIPTPLCDVITGRLRYYTLKETNKDGSLKASWLYSAKGKPLEGGTDCTYGEGIGSYVVKHLLPEGIEGVEETGFLYDPASGTVAAENVFSIEKLTKKTAVCLDAKRHMLGVCTGDGEKILEDPYGEDFTFGYSCGGFILGYMGSGCAVLNEKLEILDTSEKMFDIDLIDCGARGVICVKRENDMCHVIRSDDWKTLNTFPSTFQTTDGINVICGDDFSKDVKLHSIRGKRLAGPFDKIGLMKDESDMPIGMTIARKDDTVYVLDKKGETAAMRRIRGLTRAYSTFDGLVMCEYEFKNEWTGEPETGFALLEQRLDYLSEQWENYVKIERVTAGIYSCVRQTGSDSYRTDLFTMDKEVIFHNVARVGSADEEAIAVRGQQYYGLIDHQGNWLVKIPIPD
ncbi:MAG: hypothetical protein J5865_03405 [Lachnospiraceae bacterium]|nr:hypothetical protein [Lachnospiraceae bacterium]